MRVREGGKGGRRRRGGRRGREEGKRGGKEGRRGREGKGGREEGGERSLHTSFMSCSTRGSWSVAMLTQ